ncbi:Uncharacterised protein [Amycolatopsis camponoti]|uniref:Uncharacterized protein n=1 Tax=Amycolatopsis camponoti TaxID=2606593 RepID=A0A6I8LPQ0_9PSEU|nr:hypothetical protein [Amycolatopsis camponoti]VVJ17109.1 Uncharacterised protein [Amycolatopsis camponoti]
MTPVLTTSGNRTPIGVATHDITVVCGECGGKGCRKCNNSGTVTIVE